MWWRQLRLLWRVNYETQRLRTRDATNVQIVWRKCALPITTRTLTMMSGRDCRTVHGKQQHDLQTELADNDARARQSGLWTITACTGRRRCGQRHEPAARQWFGMGFEMPPLPTKRWTTLWRDVPGSDVDALLTLAVVRLERLRRVTSKEVLTAVYVEETDTVANFVTARDSQRRNQNDTSGRWRHSAVANVRLCSQSRYRKGLQVARDDDGAGGSDV